MLPKSIYEGRDKEFRIKLRRLYERMDYLHEKEGIELFLHCEDASDMF